MPVTSHFAEVITGIYLRTHGLDNWKVGWADRPSVMGYCDGSSCTIYLSASGLLANDEYNLRETVLHEIAHALTLDEEDDHGVRWAATVGSPFAVCDERGRPVYDDPPVRVTCGRPW